MDTVLLHAYIYTPFEAQRILSNLFAAGFMLLVMHAERSFVFLNHSLAESIKSLTPMWLVVITQVTKLVHEKLRVTATSSSTTYYLVKKKQIYVRIM